MAVLHGLLSRLRRPRNLPRHSLENPRPDQRPAAAFDPDWSDDDAADLDEEVLGPPLAALQRAISTPTAPFPVITRDGWPYNLPRVRSV